MHVLTEREIDPAHAKAGTLVWFVRATLPDGREFGAVCRKDGSRWTQMGSDGMTYGQAVAKFRHRRVKSNLSTKRANIC